MKLRCFFLHELVESSMDGLPLLFYQHSWTYIQDSLFQRIGKIFTKLDKIGKVYATHIALIPKCITSKKISSKFFSQLRPTSLCNVSYKVVIKIVATRYKEVMNKLVSPM